MELASSGARGELKSVYPLNNAATQYWRLVAVPRISPQSDIGRDGLCLWAIW